MFTLGQTHIQTMTYVKFIFVWKALGSFHAVYLIISYWDLCLRDTMLELEQLCDYTSQKKMEAGVLAKKVET